MRRLLALLGLAAAFGITVPTAVATAQQSDPGLGKLWRQYPLDPSSTDPRTTSTPQRTVTGSADSSSAAPAPTRRSAARAPAPRAEAGSSGPDTQTILLGTGLVALAAAGAGVLLVRRRRMPAPAFATPAADVPESTVPTYVRGVTDRNGIGSFEGFISDSAVAPPPVTEPLYLVRDARRERPLWVRRSEVATLRRIDGAPPTAEVSSRERTDASGPSGLGVNFTPAESPGRANDVERRGPDVAPTVWRRPRASSLAAPIMAVLGLAVTTWAFRMARGNVHLDLARWMLWAAVVLIVGPAIARLAAQSTSRGERGALVAMVAAALYFVKVLHDPLAFGFPDETVHLANVQHILDTGRLYEPNSIIPASPGYPGLESATAAVGRLSGLSAFTSGIIVVGVARIVGLVGLFLVLEQQARSDRLAAVACVMYCGAPNYVLWGSQFSYESLSLPLLLLALLCVLRRRASSSVRARRPWTVLAVGLILAVTATHHLTSYALAGLLWAIVVLDVVALRSRMRAPVDLAVIATLAPLIWLLTVAGPTTEYLGDIFERAFYAFKTTFSDHGVTRLPFQAGGKGAPPPPVPLDDRVLGLGAVGLAAILVAGGLWLARRERPADRFSYLLAAAGTAIIPVYLLRALPGTWELASRAITYCYLGGALLMAVSALRLVATQASRLGRAVTAAVLAFVMVAGGIVIGWPAAGRLPRPLEVRAGATVLVPQAMTFGAWARGHLPRDAVIAADDSSGRILLTSGFTNVPSARARGLPQLLTDPDFPPWEREVLRARKIDYIVLDRRRSSADNVTGVFFRRPSPFDTPELYYPAAVRRKYSDLAGASAVYVSRDIVVYDLRAVRLDGV